MTNKILFAKKTGMSRQFDAKGAVMPITTLKIFSMTSVGQKTTEKHGYIANIIKLGEKLVREFKNIEQSTKLDEVAKIGDLINIGGEVKGRGFTGVVKRFGFAGGPRTHGQSDRERAPGSSSSGTTLGRLMKGKKMAGRYGGHIKVVRNLEVISIDAENNIMTVKGSVPGSAQTLLKIVVL